MINKLIQMIKQGFVSLSNDDSSHFPNGQCTYNGKASEYTRLTPYGLESNPANDTWVLLINSQGQESVKFGIHSSMTKRKKNLNAGEVVLYNPESKSFIYLKEDGSIDVEAKKDLSINVVGDLNATVSGNTVCATTGNVTVSGVDITATATGNVTATGDNISGTATTKITLEAPNIALIGTIELAGNITGASGGSVTSAGTIQGANIIGTTEVTAGGKNLKAHTHPINSGSSSPGPTGVNN